VYVPFVRVEPEEGFLGSPKFFVPCSPPVRAHGLDFDLNLDKLTRQSGSGVKDTNMAGATGGAASNSGLRLSNAVTAINRGLRSKRKRKELDSRITHIHTTHNSNNDDKFKNLERMTADDLVDDTRLLKRQKRQIEGIRRLYRSCGNRSIKRLISLKR
jgi:hypothetical protein